MAVPKKELGTVQHVNFECLKLFSRGSRLKANRRIQCTIKIRLCVCCNEIQEHCLAQRIIDYQH